MKAKVIGAVVVAFLAMVSAASAGSADTFGTGSNQFTIDFVTISGSTNPTSGYGSVANDYRMGTLEITNNQWEKFKTELGVPVTGNPSFAYDHSPTWTDTNVPVNGVSWYEAAQFVNWLNTSTDHHAAYKFAGTQGTSDYAFAAWSVAEAAGGTNLYRHKGAVYYLPTEDEWVKAAYWNGTTIQNYATKAGDTLHQGNGTGSTGWNYYDGGYATESNSPWNVGSGSEELNGTFDMMGNLWDWVESPPFDGDYRTDVGRGGGLRGGSYSIGDGLSDGYLASSFRGFANPHSENNNIGFRVASEVSDPGVIPEPLTIMSAIIGLGMIGGYVRKRRAA